jgi:hypothetical protein
MKGAIFSVVLAAAGGLVNAQIYRRQNFAGEPSCAVGLSTFHVTQQHALPSCSLSSQSPIDREEYVD